MMGEKMKLIEIFKQERVHLYHPLLFLTLSLEAGAQRWPFLHTQANSHREYLKSRLLAE